MPWVYARGITALAPDLGQMRHYPRISAEQARHAAAAIDRPALANAADDAFIHAMHVGTVWTMVIALGAAAVLWIALRPTRKSAMPEPVLEPAAR